MPRARAVGVAPLRWDDALAADALAYAAELARTGRFEHAPQPRGNPRRARICGRARAAPIRYDEMVGALDRREDATS